MKENFIAILTLKAKMSTKAIFAMLTSLGAVLQIPSANKFIMSLVDKHPRVSSAVVVIGTIYTLLHNPKVQQALGMDIPEGAKVQASATVTVTEPPKETP